VIFRRTRLQLIEVFHHRSRRSRGDELDQGFEYAASALIEEVFGEPNYEPREKPVAMNSRVHMEFDDAKSPKELYSLLYNDFLDYKKLIKKKSKSKKIRIYRSISINKPKKPTSMAKHLLKYVDWKNLGSYWTHEIADAGAYHARRGSDTVILHALVPWASVDWDDTIHIALAGFGYGPEPTVFQGAENEIRLKSNVAISIDAVNFNHKFFRPPKVIVRLILVRHGL